VRGNLPDMDTYSPEWMIQPAPKPADTSGAPVQEAAAARGVPVAERRIRVDRRRAERRHKREQ
jgi:hypothetical protein